MGAPEKSAIWIERTDARQYGKEKPRQQAKKPQEKRNRSTKRNSARSLNQPADIEEAIDWRLSGLTVPELEAIADALRPFADDFREDRPEVAGLLAKLHQTDGRAAWLFACAVLAWDALRRSDILVVAAALTEIMIAYQNKQRAKLSRSPLTPMMKELNRNHPEMQSDQVFDYFAGLPAVGHEVIAYYSDERDALILHSGKEVSRDSCCRQYRRVQRELASSPLPRGEP